MTFRMCPSPVRGFKKRPAIRRKSTDEERKPRQQLREPDSGLLDSVVRQRAIRSGTTTPEVARTASTIARRPTCRHNVYYKMQPGRTLLTSNVRGSHLVSRYCAVRRAGHGHAISGTGLPEWLDHTPVRFTELNLDEDYRAEHHILIAPRPQVEGSTRSTRIDNEQGPVRLIPGGSVLDDLPAPSRHRHG